MGGVTSALFGDGGAKQALAQQQAMLDQQKKEEEAKEAKMNRERMTDMRARIGGGFGDEGSGNGDATG